MLQSFTTALDLYETLVRENPGDASLWSDLSISAHRCRAWDKALTASERAFQLNPNHPAILSNYSIILAEFGRFKRAQHLLNRALSLDPGNETSRLSLGLLQLAENNLREGWKNYASRRWEKLRKYPQLVNPSIEWRGESLAQKNLLIWHEPWEGHGDAILFLRYLSALAERAKREDGLIMFACHEQLHTLFARNLVEHCNELFVVAGSKGMAWQPQHFYGRKPLQCLTSSLPWWSGDTIPNKFSYIMPDPTKVEFWQQRLSEDQSFKVGLSWTGRADHPRNDLRSIPILKLLERLKDIPNVSFYSLQLSAPDQMEVALRLKKPDQAATAIAGGMFDFTSELSSFDDTAALVVNMDLVIGVDAVSSHLSGALGVPTWVLVDCNPHWTWGHHEPTTVWYRNVRVYRQQRMHRWEEVFEEIRADLSVNRDPMRGASNGESDAEKHA